MKKVHHKKWGNSIVFFNLKFWRCDYCGHKIKDDVPFGIVKISGETEPEIFCSKLCLKTHIIKEEAKRIGP